MSVDDPHNLSEQLKNQKEKLDDIDSEDSTLLWNFATASSKEMADSTVIQYLSKLRLISEESDKPIVEMEPLEMTRVIDNLEDEKGWSSKGTRRNYEKALRTLFRELREADPQEFGRDYAELLPREGSIRLTKDEPSKITPEDILTKSEIEELIQDACKNPRDKAIVAMLADTGMRIAALLSLRVRDVEFRDDGGGLFQPNTEATGLKGDDARKPMTWSAVHVENYLINEHPRPQEDEAPLFHKSEGWSDGEDDDGSMTPALVRQRLKRLVDKADVSLDAEDIHPHVFKHTAVTIWAKQGFSDREIKHRAGWSRDSNMLKRYEHIEEEEINKQVLKKYGFDVADDEIGEPELDRCPRCSVPLHGGENYCPQCMLRLESSPRWWQLYLKITTKKDEVRQKFEGHIPPADVEELSPVYYDHVHRVFMAATFPVEWEFEYEVEELGEEGKEWVVEHLEGMHQGHRDEHPVRVGNETEDLNVESDVSRSVEDGNLPDVDSEKIEYWKWKFDQEEGGEEAD